MRCAYKSIYKELKSIEKLMLSGSKQGFIEAGTKLRKLIKELEKKIEEGDEKSELGRKAQNFARFYVRIWENSPPEGNTKERRVWGEIIGKAKRLLEKYDLEEAKELYRWWYELNEEEVPKDLKYAFSTVLIPRQARTLLDFYHKYPKVKALKEKLEESSKSWTSPEYARGTEYYQKLIEQKLREEEEKSQEPKEQKQNLPFDEDDQIPF